MEAPSPPLIPVRAETLDLLRLLDDTEPLLMLPGDDDGYGSRWIFRGQQIEPAIARYLMGEGYLADAGPTELGVRKLALTTAGARFRHNGLQWWAGLSLLQRIKVRILG